jgi:ABC-type sugar transport system ATPase subunit
MSSGVTVNLEDVWIKFGDFVAVKEANVAINGGDFFSFLGPSGCGKTTILRAVSGFLEPSDGRVLIGGNDMSGIGPNRRPTALIFQNLALFPLMKIWENISFSMEIAGASAGERRKKADELLDMIALEGQGDKLPSELSGGQKQRVAIARALCANPDVLLLDEPLSALDLKLRQHMRTELREIQQRVGITFIYITHDQGEALTMSDNVAAAILFVLLAFVMIAMIGTAQKYSPEICKAQVREAKQADIEQRIKELQQRRLIKEQSAARQGPDIFGTPSTKPEAPAASSGAFGNVFDPSNLNTEESK